MFKKLILASLFSSPLCMIASLSAAQTHKHAQTHDHSPHQNHNHQTQNTPSAQLPAADFVFTEAPDDHVLGADFAPITIISYASVTCSHCGHWFSNIWPDVEESLVDTGKIRFVLREFPTQPQALSLTGFALAECAPKADFMSVIEYQMENQTQIFEQARTGNGKTAYKKIAKLAGLNNDAEISACLQDPSQTAHIGLSVRRADAAGVKGVPAFFINGEPYKGDQSAQAFTTIIDTMLETGASSLPPTSRFSPSDKIEIKPAITPIK